MNIVSWALLVVAALSTPATPPRADALASRGHGLPLCAGTALTAADLESFPVFGASEQVLPIPGCFYSGLCSQLTNPESSCNSVACQSYPNQTCVMGTDGAWCVCGCT